MAGGLPINCRITSYNVCYTKLLRNPDQISFKPKDLYICDITKKDLVFERLTETPFFDEDYPQELQNDRYIGITDMTGIFSKQIIEYDSTISYIDTSIHYRYYTNVV